MAVRKLYLHIGPHKTGTTYIQILLDACRPWLRDRGVLYPEHGMGGDKGHKGQHLVVADLQRKTRSDLELVQSEVRGFAGNSILSSENFSRLKPKQIAELRAAFSDFQIHVIQFVRSRADTLYSVWQEDVKHGSWASLPQYLAEVLVRPGMNHFINFARLTQKYQAIADEYSIYVYDNAVCDGVDLYDLLLRDRFGWEPPPGLQRPGMVNRRMEPFPIDVIRLLNYLHRQRRRPKNDTVRNLYLHAIRTDQVLRAQVEALRAKLEGRARPLHMANLNRVFSYMDRSFFSAYGQVIRNGAGAQLFCKLTDQRYVYYSTEDLLQCGGGWETFERIYRRVVG